MAEDLAQCVLDHVPGALVHGAADASEALRQTDGIAREGLSGLRAALVHADPFGFFDTPLGARLSAIGVPVIFLGDRAEEADRSELPATTLVRERPFSSDSVAAVLKRLTASGETAPG
jgi:hypothetical protein